MVNCAYKHYLCCNYCMNIASTAEKYYHHHIRHHKPKAEVVKNRNTSKEEEVLNIAQLEATQKQDTSKDLGFLFHGSV